MLQASEYFLNLIKSDPRLAGFENDLGIQLLARDLEYKIDTTNYNILEAIKEIYDPQREETLLAYLAYKTGYLRFKRPLQIKATITSQQTTVLDTETRFTDGNYVYYVNDITQLIQDEPKDVIMTLKEVHTFEQELTEGTLFAHIELPITYKECIGVKCYKNGVELKYSQNFVEWNSNYSLEVLSDTTLQIVFDLTSTDDVQIGDVITVVYETSFDVDTPPEGITIIETGYDLVADNIQVYSNYEPPLSISDMQYLVKFHRKNIGDFVVNEDFKQMFIREVSGLQIIKVWQQKEEAQADGYDVTDINKVFCCYLTDDEEVENGEINVKLQEVFYRLVYGRELVIKQATIRPLTVTINIKTNDPYTERLIDEINVELKRYYDDVRDKINTTEVIKKVIPILNNHLSIYEADITMNDKGFITPRKIYKIDEVIFNVSALV